MSYYDLNHPMISFFIACVIINVLLLIVGIPLAIWQRRRLARRQAERRRQVMESDPISAQEFLANWRVGKRGSGLGYAAIDCPGCYVILTNPVIQVNGDTEYEAVYVGQSVRVCSRVRQHFTGHGNGDVYADVRAGKDVQLRIIPCDEQEMNDTECELIDTFNATNSYNRTRGGSRRR